MAKYAYAITKWIGNGKDDPYTPEVASEVGYCQDVTNQYIHFNTGLPSPNLVVCKVGEMRAKYEGAIERLGADDRFLVLEEWEAEGPYNEHATLGQLRAWMAINGVDPRIANAIMKEKRTEQVRNICKGFERR